jgi:hypothetical protein
MFDIFIIIIIIRSVWLCENGNIRTHVFIMFLIQDEKLSLFVVFIFRLKNK